MEQRITSHRKGFRIRFIAPDSQWPFQFPGEWRHELPSHLYHANPGGRRPETCADRLHGLEGARQRAQPETHLSSACKGTAAGRIFVAAQEGRQTRLRI